MRGNPEFCSRQRHHDARFVEIPHIHVIFVDDFFGTPGAVEALTSAELRRGNKIGPLKSPSILESARCIQCDEWLGATAFSGTNLCRPT
jgi:hypothetical protein